MVNMMSHHRTTQEHEAFLLYCVWMVFLLIWDAIFSMNFEHPKVPRKPVNHVKPLNPRGKSVFLWPVQGQSPPATQQTCCLGRGTRCQLGGPWKVMWLSIVMGYLNSLVWLMENPSGIIWDDLGGPLTCKMRENPRTKWRPFSAATSEYYKRVIRDFSDCVGLRHDLWNHGKFPTSDIGNRKATICISSCAARLPQHDH